MTRVTSVKNCQGHESSSVQDFACVSKLFVTSARKILFFAFESLQKTKSSELPGIHRKLQIRHL
jgi:hypothetical protein